VTAIGLKIAVLLTGISAMSMIRHADSVSEAMPGPAQDGGDSDQLLWMVMEHRNLSVRLGIIGAAITTSCGAPRESEAAAMRALQC